MPDFSSLQDKLKQLNWPQVYMFKFIVPAQNTKVLQEIFKNHDVTEKPSKNGNYVSVTAKMMMQSDEAVIQIYEKASKIEGVIAL